MPGYVLKSEFGSTQDSLHLVRQGFMLDGHPVGLRGAEVLLGLPVGLKDSVVSRERDEMGVGLIQPAHTIRLIVDVSCDVLDVLHVCPEIKKVLLQHTNS